MKQLGDVAFGTKVIHEGQRIDTLFGTLATPIYQTSTFCFDRVEDAADIFEDRVVGFGYSRSANPTVAALEAKLAALEGGEMCIATASGMGAVGGLFLGVLRSGDHVVSAECVYGCTDVVLRQVLTRLGIEVTFVDTGDLDAVRNAIKPNTKLVYFETLSNPTMALTDIAAVAKIAHEHGILVAVDNTFTPPPQAFPLKEGADIVIHSCTKYINGHGDVIAGAIIGPEALLKPIKVEATTKICGSVMSPFNAYLIIRGMQTLNIRMKRHSENAMAVARYLESRPEVKVVHYPGLESFPQHETAKRMLHGIYGGIMAFELKDDVYGMDGYTACKKLLNSLKLITIAVSLGNPETLIEHAASMTHANVAPEDRASAGIRDTLIRLSVGLEEPDDLIADLEQAFEGLKG